MRVVLKGTSKQGIIRGQVPVDAWLLMVGCWWLALGGWRLAVGWWLVWLAGGDWWGWPFSFFLTWSAGVMDAIDSNIRQICFCGYPLGPAK